MGMHRKTHLNFGALARDGQGDNSYVDEETRSIMEEQSERLYAETRDILAGLRSVTAHLVDKLLEAGEMSLAKALFEIRSFEAG
jgi:cell division protease FtsH